MAAIEVTLTAAEMREAGRVGVARHVSAIRRGLADKHGARGDGWGLHIEGAAGEIAAARALGVQWCGGIDTFKSVGGDLGFGVEVRTRSAHTYDLIIRTDDRDGPYVLVTGRCPTFRVHGWITRTEAERPEWWRDYGGREWAWFVPSAWLHPMEKLEAMFADKRMGR